MARALFGSLIVVLGTAADARAATIVLGPGDDVEAAINAAEPGDELVLDGGSYTLTERFGISVQGTEQAPIVIRAADGETPHFHRPTADQNVIDVDDGAHLVFRGLEISGGSHGLRLVQASFVTVERCNIHDTGDVALSANSGDSYQGLKILRNEIHHTNSTGEGMYLGCNDDGCRVFDSLIEGNWIHHTNGSTVVQGDGIELKEGSYNNIIRDNVIHDTNYPCILTYSTVGNGAPNVIERNALWNCGDHGIQSAADAIIRNNIIFGSGSDGIAMQQHQAGSPANLMVLHNTVLHASNDAISLRNAVGSVVIANNAVYAQDGSALFVGAGDLTGLIVAGNVGEGGLAGTSGGLSPGAIGSDFVMAHYQGAPPIDVFPATGSALVAAGDGAHAVDDDFNGTPRADSLDAGAYVYAARGNPGWIPAEGFKDVPASSGAGGASSSGSGPSGAGGSAAGAHSDDGGCSCRMAASPRHQAWILLLAALACCAGRRSARR
jgi:hypothetical protein